MKLLIEYAELNPGKQVKPINGFLYSAVLESGDRTAITETIEAIYADYRGDHLENYLEPEADVFCCFLCENDVSEPKPEDIVFVSTVKKDPVAVLDGLVRRMNAVRISMSDGHFTQTFEGLSVDKKNDEDLWADKYTYTGEGYVYRTTGENVRFMLAYRDTKNVDNDYYRFNQMMTDNCIPFCFLLEGKIEQAYRDPECPENNETCTYQLDFSKERVLLDDRLLVLLKGQFTEKRIEEDITNNPCGLFYSGIKAEKIKEMTMNPWIVSQHASEGLNAAVQSRIEDMIYRGRYAEVDPFNEMLRGIKIPPQTGGPDEKYRKPVHETGHALLIRQLFGSDALALVTVDPGGEFTGDIKYHGFVKIDYEKINTDYDRMLDHLIIVDLAGKVTEELFFGGNDEGWEKDMQDALYCMVLLILSKAAFEMNDGKIYCYLNRTDAIRADDVFSVLMDRYLEKTRMLIAGKKEMILELARSLMLEKTLSGERFDELCRLYEEKH